MTKFYHYTSQSQVESILASGLKTGADVGSGERLPFIMLSRERYTVSTGLRAYFEISLDETDSKLRPVNESWIEYHGSIPASCLTALATPPKTTEETIKAALEFGLDSAEFKSLFEYKQIAA